MTTSRKPASSDSTKASQPLPSHGKGRAAKPADPSGSPGESEKPESAATAPDGSPDALKRGPDNPSDSANRSQW